MKKNCAIVTGGTAKDVAAMACLVLNIKETNPHLADEIVIIHDGIAEKDQCIINNIFPTRFIYYQYPDPEINKYTDTVLNHFTTMVFCKYECFKLLDDYHTVIWTDYDVVILNNLDELKIKKTTDFKFVLDKNITVKNMFNQFIKFADLSQYNLEKMGIFASIFVLHDSMNNYLEYYTYCLEQTKKYAQLLYLPEQCILNLLVQEKTIQFEILDYDVYSLHPQYKINSTAKIIHAYGSPKFWSGLKNKTWNKNYKKWLSFGGSKIKERTLSYIFLKRVYFLKFFLPYGVIRFYEKTKDTT